MNAPNDKRMLPYGGSFSIQDPEVIDFIKSLDIAKYLWDDNVSKNFCSRYVQWIQQTKNNNIVGLKNFPHAVYSNGTSEAFEMFYIRNKDKRFRCFKGEYIYHQLAWRNNWPNWKFIENLDIEENDAVVISLPFSNTGDAHVEINDLFDICNRKNVPVLVDCAYFGICAGIDFNFNHQCITDITFSLSKTFPVAHARIGMRLTKVDDDDLMFVYDKINYNNRLGSGLGLELINAYGPDHVHNKHKQRQIDLCQQLDIVASKSVIFGLDYKNKYPEYNRGTEINRLGLYKHLNV